MKKNLLCLFMTLFIFLTFSGCASKVNYSEVSNYSEDVLSAILTSMNNIDYDTFSSYLSDDLQESYDLGTFQSETSNILTKIGSYTSFEYYNGEDRNGYISLIYDVYYSNSDEPITLSISFLKDDDTHKVYQLYFDSEKLQ